MTSKDQTEFLAKMFIKTMALRVNNLYEEKNIAKNKWPNF